MSHAIKQQKIKYCPYDGELLEKGKFCSRCDKTVNIQQMPPRKPRNFFEKMPEGIEDNHVDEFFLKGLVHKSKHLKEINRHLAFR
jgi:hypothetical protein